MLACAGGGTPDYRHERSEGKTSTEKHWRAEQSASGRAGGRVNRTLKGSGGGESDGERGCEKRGSLCPPGGLVSGYRFAGWGDSTSGETWKDGTKTLLKEAHQSFGSGSESLCLHPRSVIGWAGWSLAQM